VYNGVDRTQPGDDPARLTISTLFKDVFVSEYPPATSRDVPEEVGVRVMENVLKYRYKRFV